MKNKVNVTEVRAEELSAELSKKTEEVQLFKVKINTLFSGKKSCLFDRLMQIPYRYHNIKYIIWLLLLQSESEMASAENHLLKKACQAAEKAQEDLKKKSTVTEVFMKFHFPAPHCFWEISFYHKKVFGVIVCFF